ncbi:MULTISPECIES: hypothetical protein [unclassified Shouchella]
MNWQLRRATGVTCPAAVNYASYGIASKNSSALHKYPQLRYHKKIP